VIYGTCNFESFEAAVAYYRPYGFSPEDLVGKLDAGEIAIGIPDVPENARVFLDSGRWHMEWVR
jgi:hypothetical protein